MTKRKNVCQEDASLEVHPQYPGQSEKQRQQLTTSMSSLKVLTPGFHATGLLCTICDDLYKKLFAQKENESESPEISN